MIIMFKYDYSLLNIHIDCSLNNTNCNCKLNRKSQAYNYKSQVVHDNGIDLYLNNSQIRISIRWYPQFLNYY